VSESRLVSAHRLAEEALGKLAAAAETASDDELVSLLAVCEGASRRLERLSVAAIGALTRRGVFAERGYATPALAADLLGYDRAEARRRVLAAEQVDRRVGLDGQPLPPRLPATAAAFTAGRIGLRHLEVLARLLTSPAAGRLAPQTWAGAEQQLAERAAEYPPAELQTWGARLLELLDQDGPQPDDRAPEPVNELFLTRHRGGAGGSVRGRIADAAAFDTIATLLDAHAAPRDPHDHRPLPQRHADALAEVCGYLLDHGEQVPETGGHRPQLNVHLRLEDLEARCRGAVLDYGGALTPAALRALACDARVIPVVLGGAGQPLDVGRATRTIPDGLRRAVVARDRGCAHPGCDRPPAWCQVHHIVEWQHGGATAIHNCVLLCRFHHRLLHNDSGWTVRLTNGRPEFLPPPWIDPHQTPRRKPEPAAQPRILDPPQRMIDAGVSLRTSPSEAET
jgi:Domain of unknown function (DUF222)/HNH endonuclease